MFKLYIKIQKEIINIFNLNNFNSTQKNSFFQVNINPMINSFNTNNNMISEGSNIGNNYIIFNNFRSINNNIFIDNNQIINQRDNTQGG